MRMFIVAEYRLGDKHSLGISNSPDYMNQPVEEILVIRDDKDIADLLHEYVYGDLATNVADETLVCIAEMLMQRRKDFQGG